MPWWKTIEQVSAIPNATQSYDQAQGDVIQAVGVVTTDPRLILEL